MIEDDDLTAAARTLHREWKSPELWPAIAEEIRRIEQGERRRSRLLAWRGLAAAAVLLLITGATLFLMREGSSRQPSAPTRTAAGSQRLLSDDALAEIERAESQYIAAIEALAQKSTGGTPPPTPLAAALHERLLVIDAAIADCRAEIEENRFNAHLRRQLLAMYQEKRRTLEQILEEARHAS